MPPAQFLVTSAVWIPVWLRATPESVGSTD